MAKVIRLERGPAGHFSLTIDGDEFPYVVSSDDPIRVVVDKKSIGQITFTVFAERVEVLDTSGGG